MVATELVTAGLVKAATSDEALLRIAARAAVLVEVIVPLFAFVVCKSYVCTPPLGFCTVYII